MTGPLGAVVAPSTPLLLPGTGGQLGGDVVAEILGRVVADITAVQALSPRRWVVVGGVASSVRDVDGASAISSVTAAVAPWPARATAGPVTVPLSLAIGQHLLTAAGIDSAVELVGIAFDAAPQVCFDLGRDLAVDGTALLVVGDGAARRTRQSPGDFDERARPLDVLIENALKGGDPGALAAVDPHLAAELMLSGRAALQVMAGAFTRSRPSPTATGLLASDPLGVRYWATTWKAI